MDVVTHALMGGILASPYLGEHPFLAGGFLIGSVLPDLDVLSRLLGKRAFLVCHQTLTHSLPCMLAVPLLGWAIEFLRIGPPSLSVGLLGTGMALGMLLHVLLDFTNTMGVALLAPFSWKRSCTAWVFFLDLPVITLSAMTLGLQWLAPLHRGVLAAAYAGILCAYWAFRAWLAGRARRLAPRCSVSVTPEPIVPWRYHGFSRTGARGETIQVNVLAGTVVGIGRVPILDAKVAHIIERLPEYRVMAGLSPAYHVIALRQMRGITRFLCRDMRTRPFRKSFGDLSVELDACGQVPGVQFHV